MHRSIVMSSFVGDRMHAALMVRKAITASMRHYESFSKFKGKYLDQEIVVAATGPSLQDYKMVEGAVHIGVNHAFLNKNIVFDYIVAQDNDSVAPVLEEMCQYRPNQCIKFFGVHGNEFNFGHKNIPESFAIKANAFRYYLDFVEAVHFRSAFTVDIATQPLGAFSSTVFSALQIAMWMCPRRIYLAGCDCSAGGHFYSDELTHPQVSPSAYSDMIKDYLIFKEFIGQYYPETEVVSINPVGLKGVFRDLYQ